MLDVHGRLNVPTAIAMCKALARFDLTWIEEPTPPESIDALAEVRANSPVPIASGERWYEPTRFLEALSKKAVDVLQPDVSHAGGLAETKRIAHLAHLHLIPVAPHNPVGPVMNAMTLHTAVAIPNFSVFETVSVDVPWRKELVKETLVFEDVQWADKSTLDLISFLARNLRTERVAIILTLRTDELDRDHPVRRWLVLHAATPRCDHGC